MNYGELWRLGRPFLLWAVYHLILLWRVSCSSALSVTMHDQLLDNYLIHDQTLIRLALIFVLIIYAYITDCFISDRTKNWTAFIGDQFCIGFRPHLGQTWTLRSKQIKEKLKMDAVLPYILAARVKNSQILHSMVQTLLAIKVCVCHCTYWSS